MPNTLINDIWTPASTAKPVVHEDLADVAEQLALHSILKFNAAADRTTAFDKLKISPHLGAVSYIHTARRYDSWNGVRWVPMVTGLIARGRRESNSSTSASTTETPVLRVDNIPILGGYAYSIHTTSLVLHSSIAGDRARATIRVDVTGTPATTASTQIGMAQEQDDVTANPPAQPAITELFPSVDGTLSVLLSVSRQGGTGNCDILGNAAFPISLKVYFDGLDPGNSGVSL